MTTLVSHLQAEDILLGLQVPDEHRLFEEVGKHMERVYGLPGNLVFRSLARREQAGSTAVGDGVAMPHARIKDLNRVHVLYLRLATAIAFHSPDLKPVSDIVVLLVPSPADQTHLDLLAEAARLFSDPAFRAALHACSDAVSVKKLFGR